jgi:uncharacterized lipoprotein YmbA
MSRRSARALVLLCSAWLLTACASRPVPTAAQLAASGSAALSAAEVDQIKTKAKIVRVEVPPPSLDDVVCRRETPTGTHQARRVCRTRGEMAVERASAQEWLRSGGRRGGGSVVPAVR